MKRARPLTPTMEDYLESIRELGKSRRAVRVRDLSERHGVEMPSVTVALRGLVNCGMVKHERYGYVELTSKGTSSARAVSGRHAMLRSFLKDVLGVSARVAELDACRMEHAISPETFKKLDVFMKRTVK